MDQKKALSNKLDKIIHLLEENNKYLYSLEREEKKDRWMKILHVTRTIAILCMMVIMFYNYIYIGNISLQDIFVYIISWTS